MSDYSSEPAQAQFNDAMGQAERMNEYLTRAQDSKLNPLAIHPALMCRNWEIRKTSLLSYWQEVRAKCNDAEIKFVNRIIRLISKADPPIQYVSTTSGGKSERVDHQAWAHLDDLLTFFEEQVRKLADVHGLGNPNKTIDRDI